MSWYRYPFWLLLPTKCSISGTPFWQSSLFVFMYCNPTSYKMPQIKIHIVFPPSFNPMQKSQKLAATCYLVETYTSLLLRWHGNCFSCCCSILQRMTLRNIFYRRLLNWFISGIWGGHAGFELQADDFWGSSLCIAKKKKMPGPKDFHMVLSQHAYMVYWKLNVLDITLCAYFW